MEELFQQLVKAGPGSTMIIVIATAVASLFFLVTSRQYKKIKDQAHTEAITLKDQTIVDWKTRCAELGVEKNRYRDQAHLNAQKAQSLELQIENLKQQPNVDSLASVLREFKIDLGAQHEMQMQISREICSALTALHQEIREKK